MQLHNYIGGQWVKPANGRYQQDFDPANGQVVAEVPRSDAEDTRAAIKAARQAFETWRKVPAPKRGEILFRVGTLLKEHKDELAEYMTREMGKVLMEARGDVQEGIDMAFTWPAKDAEALATLPPQNFPTNLPWLRATPLA